MNEIPGYTIESFVIFTPDKSALIGNQDHNDSVIDKLLSIDGVNDVGNYAEYILTVTRNDQSLEDQYANVVNQAKDIIGA